MKNRIIETIKKNTMALAVLTFIAITSFYTRFEVLNDIYARDMMVLSYNYASGDMILVDEEGFMWEYNTKIDDIFEGDNVACVMDRRGTLDITDDKIIRIF